MQFLSGVGGLGSTPVNVEYVMASLDAQRKQQEARLKANVDPRLSHDLQMQADPASRAFEQRIFEQRLIEQMRAREEKAKADAAKKKNTTVLIGAVAAIGAAFLLLK
jgi:hypothetical protein